MKKMMMGMVWMVIVGTWGGLAWAGDAPCEAVSQLRMDGQLEAAEQAGRACLEERPDDGDVKLELARALYAQGSLDEARQWAGQVVEASPDNDDAQIFKARLLGHGADYARALERLDGLSEETRQSEEVQRLRADVLLWSGANAEAVTAYERHLEQYPEDGSAWTNLGHAFIQAGRSESRARGAYERSCELGEEPGCLAYEALLEGQATRYFVRFQPGYTVVFDGSDGHHLRVSAGFLGETSLEVGYHQVTRGFDDVDTLRDHGVTAQVGRALPSNFQVGAGAGVHFSPNFSPDWTAFVEGSRSFERGFVPGLRLWRMHFSEGGANIINPWLTYYLGRFALDGRYFLSISDGGDIDHAALARVSYYLRDYTSLRAGVGVGTSPDFVDLANVGRRPTLSQYSAFVGASLELRNRHQFDLDLRYQHEGPLSFGGGAASDDYRSLDVLLGYRVFVW